MQAHHGLAFLGRARERELLDGMLAEAREGQSAVLVIRGEPGIGKTALLRYAARQASGFHLVQIAGVQAEMELPFAGLHRLSAPMLDRLDVLPEPQRNALNVALGVSPGDAPDRFLVAVAVLSLLSATAEERPLLCLVDDAQWLDAASGQALGFVARRLLAESVAVVFAVREPIAGRTFDGLSELQLGGLEEADARALLSRAVPGRLDEDVSARIIAESRGNPLALLELPQSMSAAERAGGYAHPAADLPGQLEVQYMQRIAKLPEGTQRLILLAAGDPLGDATTVWRAAHQLSIDASALAPAAKAGLLQIDDRVRFRHPLVRSAVYRRASPDARQRVHEALAEVSDPELDADRRAWHRALAAAGPDEAIAVELERAAERAQARGGPAAAAALLERAAALSQDPARAAERALAAAAASLQAGAFDTVLRLVATAEAYSLDGFQAARADLLRGHVALVSRFTSDAAPLLLEAARRLEPFDLELARTTYLGAYAAAFTAAHLGRSGIFVEVCRAVRALPPPPATACPHDVLLDALAMLTTDGRAAATPALQRASTAVADMPVEDVLRWGWMAANVSLATWDSDGSTAILERQAQLVRAAGALAELPLHLIALAQIRLFTGDLSGVELLIAESGSVAAATGSQLPPFATLRLRALQGREAEARALIKTTIKQATAAGSGIAVIVAEWAAAILYNGLSRYEDAVSTARRAAKEVDPFPTMWALPELVEAAARVGDHELARTALQRLAETTQPARTDWALGLEARCRALLADGDRAEVLYREALDRLSHTPLGPELARAHLLFGEWLRGEGRSVEARAQLRTADDMFVAIGMMAFAARARRGLKAAGGMVRPRSVEIREQLSPQEEQIAGLARDGLTNAEIGGQLFLSPRTVEWHLHKVYGKLGISSRSGLGTALAPPG